MFSDIKVNITTEGKRHLVAAIGSNEFRIKYVTEKVSEWCEELKPVPNFVKSYAAFCFGEQNKYSYFVRTIPSMSELMKPVDEVIQNNLLPSIIGKSITENQRRLYSLPTNSGVQGIYIFS